MRLRARADGNQTAVVQALRQAGRSVLVLSGVGRGCPDLLVGWPGGNLLLEVKDGSKPPSARKLTPDEADFFVRWRGPCAVVSSVAEALAATGIVARESTLTPTPPRRGPRLSQRPARAL